MPESLKQIVMAFLHLWPDAPTGMGFAIPLED
jgi:hypothetical protein